MNFMRYDLGKNPKIYRNCKSKGVYWRQKDKEVERRRHIFRQLYGNVLLDSYAVFDSDRCHDRVPKRKEPEKENGFGSITMYSN